MNKARCGKSHTSLRLHMKEREARLQQTAGGKR